MKDTTTPINNTLIWFESLVCPQREELFPECDFTETKPSLNEINIAHRCFILGKHKGKKKATHAERERILKIIDENRSVSESLESKNEFSTQIMNGFFDDVCRWGAEAKCVSKQEICDDFWAFLAEYRNKCFNEIKINSEATK